MENFNCLIGHCTRKYFITQHIQHSAKFCGGYECIIHDAYCPSGYNLVGRQNNSEKYKRVDKYVLNCVVQTTNVLLYCFYWEWCNTVFKRMKIQTGLEIRLNQRVPKYVTQDTNHREYSLTCSFGGQKHCVLYLRYRVLTMYLSILKALRSQAEK